MRHQDLPQQPKNHLRKNLDVCHHHLVHHGRKKTIKIIHKQSKGNDADALPRAVAPAPFHSVTPDLVDNDSNRAPVQVNSDR